MKKAKGRKLFGTLSSTWDEKQWRGRTSKSDQSNYELCLCVKVLQLLFRQYVIRIPRRNLATDAPETGAVICTSAGATKDGLKRAVIERETEKQLTANHAAPSLVHRLFRRFNHRRTDVTMILVCRSGLRHGQAAHFLRKVNLEDCSSFSTSLPRAKRKKKGSLSGFRDFDITNWVVAASLDLWRQLIWAW